MHPFRVRRGVACICIALFGVSLTQCASTARQGPRTVIQPGGEEVTLKDVVGVTLNDGRDIRFDARTRVFVRGDTLQAQVGAQPLGVAVADVQLLWVRSISGNKTTALVIALIIVALIGFAAFAASQIEYELP